MYKIKTTIITVISAIALAGCAQTNVNINVNTPEDETQESVGLANPWHDYSQEAAREENIRMFVAPEGAENIHWSIMDPEEGAPEGEGQLIQLQFDLKDEYSTLSFTARYQYGAPDDKDISGMYYDWTATDEGTLANWGEGHMPAKFYRYVGEDEMADLCTWYDLEIGIAYSLSVQAPDLDGFDIQAIAESMYLEDPNEFGYGPTDFLQYQSGVTEFDSYEDVISHLQEGQGYAYINVYGYDGEMLAVAEQVFEADHSAADMSLYMLEDGKPVQVSNVYGNGSAFPIRLEDGIIYSGDNHTYESSFMNPDGGLMVKDYINDGVNDGSGNFTGFLRDDNNYDNDKDFTGGRKEFDELIAARDQKPIIEFTVVGKEEAATEHKQAVDISGCDTFTQIVDKKLEPGMAYTNAPLYGDGVLLVASGAFDDLDGHMAAIDAEVYIYTDDSIAYAGYAESGGTAYPLAEKDGKLYSAGNHFVTKYAVTDGKLAVMETAGETFDTDGNATYYYDSDDGGDYSDLEQNEAKKIYDSLWEEYSNADILIFDTIK